MTAWDIRWEKVPLECHCGWSNITKITDSSALCRGRRSKALDHHRMSWVTLVERSQAPVGDHITGRDTVAFPISTPDRM